VVIDDAERDPAMVPFLPVLRQEGIGALAFIPLVAGESLIGKFMVYFEQAHRFTTTELDMARAIADHVAAAMSRFASITELEQTVRFNEMFTGILGHDLRNPLSAIMTAAQVIVRRGDAEKVAKPVSRILTSGERMSRMIDQLLDFTRVRVGTGIPIFPRTLDLRPLLTQIIEELDDANPEWTIRHVDVGGDATGDWDGDRLSQVFSNLIANAIQHGVPEHGAWVRLDGGSPDVVRIEVHNMGEVDPELAHCLFEPMAGGDRRRYRSQGLGLGLYISHEILRAHGGSVEVESSAETGTTFRVTLPRRATSKVEGAGSGDPA
jgi:signal transduction histidine kinase